MRTQAVVALVALLASETIAGAYDQQVHVWLSTRAYPDPTKLPVGAEADAAAIQSLRERLWRAGAAAADPDLKRRFLERHPTRQAFDAWVLKQFLALNPDKRIAGLDDTPLPGGSDGAGVYALASRLPDDDERNRDRFRHDERRAVVQGPYGTPLPDDPATLEMGGLTGLSSQAHAHYQLADVPLSDDPEVLKKDPRRFAVPPTVHTFGAAFAEVYTALAVLALDGPAPSARLQLTHAGAAAHHLEDVANQIHAVQVGVYDFFVDAKLDQLLEELRSVGGLLRPRPTFVQIGIDIIANHHTLAEALYQKHLLAPGDPVRTQSESAPPDPAFEAMLRKIPDGCEPGFGRAIAMALAEVSSFEGPQVYAAIRAVADRRFSKVGQHYEAGDDPDAAIRAGADLSRFYELEARGARRAQQALAAWWQRFDRCRAATPEVRARFTTALIKDRLDLLDAAEARWRAWPPTPPARGTIDWWVPAGYALALAAIALMVRRSRRRTRRGRG